MFYRFRHIPQLNYHLKRLFSSKKITPPSHETAESKTENLVSSIISPPIQSAINEQINTELFAAYTYLSISFHFSKSTVGLLGFSKLYSTMSKEELDHANSLARYLLTRNGTVDLNPIRKPSSCDWSNIGTTLTETLMLENGVSESLSGLYRLAEKQKDPTTADFIVTEFFKEQIQSIREINLLLSLWRTLEKVPDGVYLLDRELQEKNE